MESLVIRLSWRSALFLQAILLQSPLSSVASDASAGWPSKHGACLLQHDSTRLLSPIALQSSSFVADRSPEVRHEPEGDLASDESEALAPAPTVAPGEAVAKAVEPTVAPGSAKALKRVAANLTSAPVPLTVPAMRGCNETTPALRIEFEIAMALSEIHSSPYGPLPRFIGLLTDELRKAVNLPPERLVFLGVRGEYITVNAAMLESANLSRMVLLSARQPEESGRMESQDSGATASFPLEFTIADLEVLPGKVTEPTPLMILNSWGAQLNNTQSGMLTGPLSGVFNKTQLALGPVVGNWTFKPGDTPVDLPGEATSPPEAERSGASSNRAWSFGHYLRILGLVLGWLLLS